MEQVLIGFGSNLGDPIQTCRDAMEALGRHPCVTVRGVSSLYRTKPVGKADQNWFINGAIRCETSLPPEDLLAALHELENQFGRSRSIHWGPRTLDLDILLFGNIEMTTPHLTIPHPRLHERLFVLVPLEEIAPNWIHPRFGIMVQELLERFSRTKHDQTVERLESP